MCTVLAGLAGHSLRLALTPKAVGSFDRFLALITAVQKIFTSGLVYAALRKECLDAVRQWPGCETISGIQIIRRNMGGFSVRVTLYGAANRRLADRAMRAVEREKRRYFHLIE